MSEMLTLLPFQLAGKIYRSPMPFSPMFDPDKRVLPAYLDAGIQVVVMLAEDWEVQELTGEDIKKRYRQHGMSVIHAPIKDFSVPQPQDLQTPIQKTLDAAREGKTIAIHCHAGWGRTGIFAACLAKVVLDMTAEDAVQWLRNFIPRAVENQEQYQFVRDFEFIGE
jgi:protein-tyrosine phosphatase